MLHGTSCIADADLLLRITRSGITEILCLTNKNEAADFSDMRQSSNLREKCYDRKRPWFALMSNIIRVFNSQIMCEIEGRVYDPNVDE